METKEREQLRNVCKHAVKECMRAAEQPNYVETSEIESFIDHLYFRADYDKPDIETFKKTYIAAYEKAQELLIIKPTAFSFTVRKCQLVENMKWEQYMHDSFDAAYAVISERVEAVAMPQQEEVAL
jgi:hypothetical protein